jgi:hypothetical protein
LFYCCTCSYFTHVNIQVTFALANIHLYKKKKKKNTQGGEDADDNFEIGFWNKNGKDSDLTVIKRKLVAKSQIGQFFFKNRDSFFIVTKWFLKCKVKINSVSVFLLVMIQKLSLVSL